MSKSKPHWTEEEIRLLKEHYHSSRLEELKKLFPRRSGGSISHKGTRLQIYRASVSTVLRQRRIPELKLEEKVYIAGIIDGEGTITLYVHGGIMTSIIDLCNNHLGLIDWLEEHLHCGSRYTNINHKRVRPTYHIKFYRLLDVKALLEQVLPYLIVKRKQAELVLEFCNLRLQDKFLEYNPKLYDLAIEVRKLNERGASK